MLAVISALYFVAIAFFAYMAGHFLGYDRGVRHTEERWSDAVAHETHDDFRAGFERGRQEKCH